MATDLASFPFARQGQVPAEATTTEMNITAGAEYEIASESETRSYILLRNLTSGVLRYYYFAGADFQGFTVKPFDTVRIVNRMAVYIMGAVDGKVCFDVGNG